MSIKRGQISTEYIIVISFILFFVMTALGVGLTYSSQIKNTLKFDQIENFAEKVTSSAESVYYSGHPARTTITAYLPEGIKSIQIIDFDLVFTVETPNGDTITAFPSNVNMTGIITPNSGVRLIHINASLTKNAVEING